MLFHILQQQQRQQPFYGPLSGTTQMSWYQKKHSPTHIYHGHKLSLICLLHLLQSMASSLFNPRALQSFSTISLNFLWSTSWPGTLHFMHHTFLHLIFVFFSQHMPIHCNLIAVVLRLSFNSSLSALYLELYLNATHPSDHSHLCPLKCHLIFFITGHVLFPCNILLCTQASHHSIFHRLDVLPATPPTNSNSSLHSCISISVYTQHVIT